MKFLWVLSISVLLLYTGSGFFVVKANEKAVVRRFGKVQKRPDGSLLLKASGLHFDLPWPLATIDRVNLNEVRTLLIGISERDDFESSGLLTDAESSNPSQFLTGDKIILHLQINVQYRVSELGLYDFLYATQQAEQQLALLVESNAADLISRSGVDFVHPLGLGELRALMTSETRRLVNEHRLGIEVDEVTINSVYPPVRVKAYFLDVSNARADKAKFINTAYAYAEQRAAAARAETQQVLDQAEIYRQQQVESARGTADSFTKIVEQFKQQHQQGIHSYAEARQMAMNRLYIDSMEQILRQVAGKVLLDSGKPVDLTIFRDPKE